jgi:hypothetical protein
MSVEKKKATLEDLLGPANKTQEVFLDTLKISVTIRNLCIGDMALINAFNKSRKWEDDPYRTSIGIIQKGMVDPPMKYEDVERLPVMVSTELVNKISELSGWAKQTQEEVRNL